MKLVLLRRIIGLALLSCSLTAARLPAEDGATPTARVDGEVVTLEEVKGPIASRIGLLERRSTNCSGNASTRDRLTG